MAALVALPVAVFLVIVMHAVFRGRSSLRQPTRRDRSEVEREPPSRTKRKV